MRVTAGQRWASATEADLGLGLVVAVEGRRLTIEFPAADERRTYAIDSAPLTRIRYGAGDRVRDVDERDYRIDSLEEDDGLITYVCRSDDGEVVSLPEERLNAFVQFTTPRQRMQSGQFDRNADFRLRLETLRHVDRLHSSSVRGLLGCRTELLPHQVHIASEVASREAPRVLLADEVGLGKTIEAGMILHHRVLNGQARRVLIVVPDSLVHQWLVEMLRRFNLRFAIFDSPRVEALQDEGHANPFEAEQQVLCGTGLLTGDDAARELLLSTDWDLVVVDEAHHLRWPAEGSMHADEELAYRCVEVLAERSPGLLLLTATPEQAGAASHFARLRLLDPARFHDLDEYLRAESGYQALNAAVAPLLTEAPVLSEEQRRAIADYLGEAVPARPDETTCRDLVRKLVDRHGTGRVLFRNTRAAVPDFPPRVSRSVALERPQALSDTAPATLDEALYPEIGLGDDWLRNDPRVAWLVKQVADAPLQKFLVICHRTETARTLDQHLTLREGIRSTSFYEGLSIVERDRAAAYFAEGQDDPGGGAQVLVCSEIGSEGRDFQFAEHLVLFDLPPWPDLLEQRIGRLDRIGRRQDIHIHVPYLAGTAQEALYRWYGEGLGLFERSFAAGQSVYDNFERQLLALLLSSTPCNPALDELVEQTARYAGELAQRLAEGRDRLVEITSCDPVRASRLIDDIIEEESTGELQRYADLLFDRHGVDQDYHSPEALILRPGQAMSGHFPGLHEDGTTVTFSREKALVREDMAFLSWEHPMISAGMEMVLEGELGNAAMATIALPSLPAGMVLLEAIFSVAIVAPRALQLERYLPPSPMRYLLTQGGHDATRSLPAERLDALCADVPPDTIRQVAAHLRPLADDLFGRAEALAEGQLDVLRERAQRRLREQLGAEIERMQALRKVNPAIREEEIFALETRLAGGSEFVARATLRPQAVRLIVNSPG